MVDMSDQCFDELRPEQDPSLLASFLNSTILGAFSSKKSDELRQGQLHAQSRAREDV